MPINIPKSSLIPEWVSEPSVMDSAPKRMAGSVIRMLGLDDPASTLPTPNAMGTVVGTVGTEVAKKVAPKRAAMELVDLLLSRSKRVNITPPSPHVGVTPELAGYTGTKPPAPTRIQVRYDPIFADYSRTLPRAEGIQTAFRQNQKFAGMKPNGARQISVGSNIDRSYVAPPQPKQYAAPARVDTKLEQFRDTVRKNGSAQQIAKNAGVTMLTEKEINNMLRGPLKAVKAGMMTQQEADLVIAANKAKIEALTTTMQKVDQKTYRKTLEDTVLKRSNRKVDPR